MLKSGKILAGAGAAALGLAAGTLASAVVAKELVDIAMDSNAGLNFERGRLAGTELKATDLEEAAEAGRRLRGSETETLEIRSRDGKRLVGHWRECSGAKRVILAMHGWRSAWYKDFGIIADFWNENGCSVLYAGQRGQSESGGDYMGFGLIERFDCLDWLEYIVERTGGELPVYMAGVSMGASTVLMASGLELPSQVRGIMADCGYTSVHDIWKHVSENNLHLHYGFLSPVAERVCRSRINAGTRDFSAPEALRRCRVPVMFAHGTGDSFVPVEMTYENYMACAAPKRLFIVPGAEHGMSYLADREGYQRNTLEFWQCCEAACGLPRKMPEGKEKRS